MAWRGLVWSSPLLASVAARLGPSCLTEPYRASIFRFLGERDNLSVPGGRLRAAGTTWHRITLLESWEWRCLFNGTYAVRGGGTVASLNCVYLLAPCRENLPINCILILSANFQVFLFIFLFFFPLSPLSLILCCPAATTGWIYDPLFTLCCPSWTNTNILSLCSAIHLQITYWWTPLVL